MNSLIRIWIYAVALPGSIYCFASEGSEFDRETASTAVEVVSLVRILSRPEEFSGQAVTVSGILDSDGRGAYLYLTKAAFEHFDLSLGARVLLQIDQRAIGAALHGEYVVVTATVEYQDWSHPKQILLKGVRRIEGRPSRE